MIAVMIKDFAACYLITLRTPATTIPVSGCSPTNTLNKAFIKAIKAGKPAAERHALKERIKIVLEQIEQLEAERAAKSN
jgi:hypothetical protein